MTIMAARLPDDDQMRRYFSLGWRDSEVAEEYGVTRQAVQKRWRKLGLKRAPFVSEVTDLLNQGWDFPEEGETAAGSTRAKWHSRMLRSFLRRRLGDVLVSRETDRVRAWATSLREENAIMIYTAERGWHPVPRESGDRPWVVRWPSGRPLPNSRHQRALTLPPEGEEVTPVDR